MTLSKAFIATLRGLRGFTGLTGAQGLDGVNAVANDTATAGYISTAGTSATKTALEKYSVTAASSTQRFMAVVKNETRDLSLMTVGDSTGDQVSEWVYLLAGYLAADFPRWTIKYRVWDVAGDAYAAEVVLSAGTGSRTLTIWNASISGSSTVSYQGLTATKVLYTSPNPDLTLIALGHNEDLVEPELVFARMVALTEQLTARVAGTDVVLVAQNPAVGNTNQQMRAEQYREIAARRGFGFCDVQQAFIDYGDWATGLIAADGSGKHPNAAGSELWAQVVRKAFIHSGGQRNAQPPSTLTLRGDGGLLNGNLADLTGGALGSWKQSNVTVTRNSTTYKSATVDPATGALVSALSVNLVAGAGLGSYISQNLPPKKYAGQWVTFGALLVTPPGSGFTVARLAIEDSTSMIIHPSDASGENDFAWVTVTKFVPANATSLRVILWVDSSVNGGNCTVDRFTFGTGKFPFGS